MSGYAVIPKHVIAAMPKMSANAFKVAGAIASFMGKKREAWPSIAAIAERAGYHQERSVKNALAELQELGLIVITRRGQHYTSLYSWPPGVNETTPSGVLPEVNETTPSERPRGERKRTPEVNETTPLKNTMKNTNNAPLAAGDTTDEVSTKPNGGTIWARWLDVNKEAGRKPPIPLGPDTAAAKALAALFNTGALGAGEVTTGMTRYLGDVDPHLMKLGHPLRLLPQRINAYRNRDRDEDVPDLPQELIDDLERKAAEA